MRDFQGEYDKAERILRDYKAEIGYDDMAYEFPVFTPEQMAKLRKLMDEAFDGYLTLREYLNPHMHD